jgi:hypothetical protein
MVLYTYVLCLRILASSRISGYDLVRRTLLFKGDSVIEIDMDSDMESDVEVLLRQGILYTYIRINHFNSFMTILLTCR